MSQDVFEGLPLLQEARPDYAATGLVRDIFVAPDMIEAAAKRLLEAGFHLEDLSGLDTAEGFLINYHFDHFDTPGRMALRVMVPHDSAKVPSIAAVFNGAEWHERELTDFYGVVFDNNPNPVALLLPAEDVCTPLVKSEKARVSVSALLKYDTIVQRDADFDLFAPPDDPAPESKEAPN